MILDDEFSEAFSEFLENMGGSVELRGHVIAAVISELDIASKNGMGGQVALLAVMIHVKDDDLALTGGTVGDIVTLLDRSGRRVRIKSMHSAGCGQTALECSAINAQNLGRQ